MFKTLFKLPWEAIIWCVGLTLLACTAIGESSHYTICPFTLMGFENCTGCGLGRSISLLFHGEIRQSFEMHPLGLFAVIILTFRIFEILKQYFKSSWHV